VDTGFLHLEELTKNREPAFLMEIYENYLRQWPADAKRQLRYANLCLEAVEKGGKDRRERLLKARQAAALARSLSTEKEDSQEAESLLKRILEELGSV